MSDATGLACTHCGATITNGLALCATCTETLRVALTNTAAYHGDVDRIRPGQRVKTRSAYQSTPPPGIDPPRDPISDALHATDNAIATWCRVLTDDRPGIGDPPATTVRRCGWLEGHVPTIVTLAWAVELLRETLRAERDLRDILDNADTGWYAGVCGNEVGRYEQDGETIAVLCERGLYGTQSSSWIPCPECGRLWDTASRHDQLMREARDQLGPVSVVARACVGLLDDEVSVQRLSARIDQWVHRGKLQDYGVRVLDGQRAQRVYRIGDVFDLLGVPKPGETGQAC